MTQTELETLIADVAARVEPDPIRRPAAITRLKARKSFDTIRIQAAKNATERILAWLIEKELRVAT